MLQIVKFAGCLVIEMIKAIVKNYLRNSMGQERLNGLALLSIEASRTKVMNVDQLIDQFAEIKSRCKDLSNTNLYCTTIKYKLVVDL